MNKKTLIRVGINWLIVVAAVTAVHLNNQPTSVRWG